MDNIGFDSGGIDKEMFKNLMNQLKQDDSVIRVQLNDQRLIRLAEYDASHGYMKTGITKEVLQSRFEDLKGLVKKGSMTLKELEDDVYSRWGVTEESRDEALNRISEEGLEDKPLIGFHPDNLEVADIPEDSPENH
jgi:hypothetical protein